VKLVEPPSCSSTSAIVFIGKNKRGNWVVQEQNGLYGGLFVNRAQAVQVRPVREWPSPRNNRRAVARNRARHARQVRLLRSHTSRPDTARRMTRRTAIVQGEPDGSASLGSNREQVVDTMIELTRLSKLHRAIVAGGGRMELYLAPRRRGFICVATAATYRNIYSTYAQPKSLLLLNSQLPCACCRLLLRQEACGRSSQEPNLLFGIGILVLLLSIGISGVSSAHLPFYTRRRYPT
jgi:hypothetical protein